MPRQQGIAAETMSEQSDLLNKLKIEREPFADSGTPAWRWVLLLLIVLLIVGAAYFKLKPAPPPLIKTSVVRLAGASDASASVLDASGYVVARRRATVSSKVTGKVMELFIEEGTRVSEGDVLARIDDANILAQIALGESQLAASKAQLAEVQVQLADAQRNLKRTQELSARKLLSDSALDSARASVDSLQARLQSVRSNVTVSQRNLDVLAQQKADTVVHAPFDGVITVKNAQPGEMISPLSAGGDGTRTGIGTLVDMDSLEIEVDVNENFINRVQPGQLVESRLNAYPDWKIPSEVIAVVPTADRSKATVKVRIGLSVQDPRILPEMGVRVSFLTAADAQAEDNEAPSTPKILVESQAVLDDDDQAVVFLVKDQTLERRAIKTGAKRGNSLEVLAGLQGGETLAVGDLAHYQDGMTVRLEQE